jgi:hypothetical protein
LATIGPIARALTSPPAVSAIARLATIGIIAGAMMSPPALSQLCLFAAPLLVAFLPFTFLPFTFIRFTFLPFTFIRFAYFRRTAFCTRRGRVFRDMFFLPIGAGLVFVLCGFIGPIVCRGMSANVGCVGFDARQNSSAILRHISAMQSIIVSRIVPDCSRWRRMSAGGRRFLCQRDSGRIRSFV